VRFLERCQAIDRSTDLGGVALSARDEFSHGSTVLGNDESLTFLNSSQKLWQLGFGFECIDFWHASGLLNLPGSATTDHIQASLYESPRQHRRFLC